MKAENRRKEKNNAKQKGENSEKFAAGKFENMAENQLLKSGLNKFEGKRTTLE